MIDLETHEAVFTWMLQRLADAGLVKGKTVGVDATTLEANAALRSIMRRDTGESYQDFLTKLALIGVGTPRALQGRLRTILAGLLTLIRSLCASITHHRSRVRLFSRLNVSSIARSAIAHIGARETAFTTGC